MAGPSLSDSSLKPRQMLWPQRSVKMRGVSMLCFLWSLLHLYSSLPLSKLAANGGSPLQRL